ncbi:MAG: aldo/keto reductase [Candidatus Latescibacteria bacterium]|nr:aldo/keto reductase [Candidatus Latescibacterota bacterium]MBT5829309.1 aldo/keto reductase [Candidatus Latescibacterota bacterium]
MTYNKLGNTDINVSPIALGCWPFAGGAVWGDQDDNVSVATVHAALDAGINFFDTAEGYEKGHSERVLGQGLKGRRNEAIIATKVSANNLSAEGIVKACEQSLKNLQTDTIDLYQIHWPNWNIPIQESMTALEQLCTQGKVRTLGVCNFGPIDLTDLLSVGSIVTNQLPYSLLWRVIEREIQPICNQNNIGLLCYSPLMQGLLTGRYKTADDVPEGLARIRLYSNKREMAKHDDPGCETEVFDALKEIQVISEEIGHPMAAVALAWVKQQKGVTSLLVGARNPEEIAWNLPAIDLTLSEDIIQRLTTATETVKNKLGNNPDFWMSKSRMR